MDRHLQYMQRCLQLASLGLGSVAPNPMVGAVLVHDNKIIAEGYHRKFGGPHAEVDAINNVPEDQMHLISKSTLYVSLEPCSHFGKTPPCADLIIEKKIPEVVIATTDPNPVVAGKGIEKLKSAGVKVTVGVMERQARDLNKRFFTFIEKKRPYVILKWAQSKDGFIARHEERTPISNAISQRLVHKWRGEEKAIMIGTNTAAIDNPELNARLWPSKNQPVRIVLDREKRLSPELKIFDGAQPTIVFTEFPGDNPKVEYIQIDFRLQLIHRILEILHHRNIQSLIVEGGSVLLRAFIESGLWDEARIFTGNIYLQKGLKAPFIEAIPLSEESLGDNILKVYKNNI